MTLRFNSLKLLNAILFYLSGTITSSQHTDVIMFGINFPFLVK